jgi:hypothetical protein
VSIKPAAAQNATTIARLPCRYDRCLRTRLGWRPTRIEFGSRRTSWASRSGLGLPSRGQALGRERRHEMSISGGTLAQNTAPAKRPTVGGKPVVQVKPSAPPSCKLIGTVKGTKLWAGDCTASELRTTVPAEETSKPPPDEPVGAIPKGEK